eukprot:10163408-Alexandrium_andersonii.AAC.1
MCIRDRCGYDLGADELGGVRGIPSRRGCGPQRLRVRQFALQWAGLRLLGAPSPAGCQGLRGG